jgi:ATP-binding protein involved in chromosome partitioning
MVTRDEVYSALSQVQDPEIHRPITELDMVPDVAIDDDGVVTVSVLLTVPGCPLKDRITKDVTAAVSPLPGVSRVVVDLGVMSEQQRGAMVTRLRGGQEPAKRVAFWGDDSTTRVLAVASGKGGVGKSSVTVNLAAALAAQGHRVAVVDCDIYGFSVPRMLGATGRPVGFNGMILPLEAHGVRVISIGFFIEADKPVMWRGPMLHRAVQQFLTDVHWGEVDYVLADLPPGTGDVSISLAQMLPGAEMLLVTTPQEAAERVAVLAGKFALANHMKVAGVVENMSYFVCPDCDERHEIFGRGGGEQLAADLGAPLLGRIPIDPRLREGADNGKPLVVSDPDAPASQELLKVAAALPPRPRSLVGKRLKLLT